MDSRVMELRMQKWISVIEEQAKSGMGKDEWCALHGINRTTFFRWQRRVRKHLLDRCEAQPPQLPSATPSDDEVCFVELPSAQVSPAGMTTQRCGEAVQAFGAPPSISIHYGGFSIDLNGCIDEAHLSMILRGLKHAD